MSHVSARLTVHGRRLLVQRVTELGWSVAQTAEAMGVSRQCAHRWLARWRAEGDEGLADRSSRPRACPRRVAAAVEEQIVAVRRAHRRGQDWIAVQVGVSARTVGRVLARRGEPPLRALDPLTGQVIRSSKTTATRYERERPGELVHVDVKKLAKIPDGGGWRAHGRAATQAAKGRRPKIGYDYVHSMVDDHTRVAYSEVLPDETGQTCAAFLARAAAYFAAIGIERIERVMTDNAFAYRNSHAFQDAVAAIGARQKFIKAHCPWQNGKVERYNRTLATEWAYACMYASNTERTTALAAWVEQYNTERHHTALGGATPISRVSPTS